MPLVESDPNGSGERVETSRMSTYARAAAFYDLLYGQFKDYRVEAERLLEIFSGAGVPVTRVLDVGCGTGQHARFLTEAGLSVDGIDLDAQFVHIAQRRNPTGHFQVGDMTAFEVERPYDAVLCLFGSIGHVVKEDRLHAAIGRLAAATRPGGLLVLEPWFEPGVMQDGFVVVHTAKGPELELCRMARTSIHEDVSRLEFEYLVGRPDGIERLSEVHELGLFPRTLIDEALRAQGLEPTFDPQGLIGRGLWVAHKAVT